jgi:predicted nucleic acid-binding protein
VGLTAGDSAAGPLDGHSVVGIDSNVFIYLLETTGDEAIQAGRLLDLIDARALRASLSAVAVAEVLTGPARAGDVALMERYLDEIQSIDGLSIVPIDADVAFNAARLRGRESMALPDSLNLAAARIFGATAFITNDRRLRSSHGLKIIPLVAFAP